MKDPLPGHSGDGKFDATCSIDDGRKIYDIADEALTAAAAIGVVVPDRPVYDEEHEELFQGVQAGMYFDGRVPTVVRRLTLDQLSNLYALLLAWYSYLAAQLGEWRIRKSQTKAIANNTEAYLRELYKGRGASDQGARDQAKHDHRFVEDLAAHERADAVFSLVEMASKTASKNLELVSREITVRGLQIEANKSRGFNRRLGNAARGDYDEPPPRGYRRGGVGDVEATDEAGGQGGNSEGPRRSRWG